MAVSEIIPQDNFERMSDRIQTLATLIYFLFTRYSVILFICGTI